MWKNFSCYVFTTTQADNAEIISGNIIYDGNDLVSLNEEELRKVGGLE